MKAEIKDTLKDIKYPLDESKAYTIGRSSDSDIKIPGAFNNISRVQTIIKYNPKEGKYIIVDFLSFQGTNVNGQNLGTYINGEKVEGKILSNKDKITLEGRILSDGDVIILGESNYYKLLFTEVKENVEKK